MRKLRHVVLMFAVGFSWGYVAKTIAVSYLYTGYDDPQVVESADAYSLKRLVQPDGSAASSPPEDAPQNEDVPGTVSI